MARAQRSPSARIAALHEFISRYPRAAERNTALRLLLDAQLAETAPDIAAVHTAAEAVLNTTTPGLDRWTEEARLADKLADTGDHGIDLADAKQWAADAVNAMTEAAYRQQARSLRRRYRLPALPPGKLHQEFAHDRSACLRALANVELHDASPGNAGPLLIEALRLDPLSAEGSRLQAQLALRQGHPREALDALLRADALAPLPAVWRRQEVDLYGKLEHGDEAALERRLDALYSQAFPTPFRLPHRELPAGGHPVLLELFTGSDCAPCAAPDLALDSLLSSYGHGDLIGLAFDENIPTPDPLATPESVEHAAVYGVESTPAVFLDGDRGAVTGGSRAMVENLVLGFADQVEALAELPSTLEMRLAATQEAGGTITVHLSLQRAANRAPGTADQTTGETSMRALSHAVVGIALVQDRLRYAGQNGVRFHRMVVRALRQLPAAAFFVAQTGQAPEIRFNPGQIQRDLAAYWKLYGAANAAPGTLPASTLEPPLAASELRIVAWVQDPVTRRVLQSGFAQPSPK